MARWRWTDLPELLLESFDPSVRPPQRVLEALRHEAPPEPRKRINFLLELVLAASLTVAFIQLATFAWGPGIDRLAPFQAGALLFAFLFCGVGVLATVFLVFFGMMERWPDPSWNAAVRGYSPRRACETQPLFPSLTPKYEQLNDAIKDTLLDFEPGGDSRPPEEVVRIPTSAPPVPGRWAERYRRMHEHELRSW